MNAEVDRLSNLPDDIINKILSFNDTEHAIRTSILSSRWKNIWKSIPHLSFSYDCLTSLPKFYDYANLFLSSRNNEIELESVKLSFNEEVSQDFVKKILNYAFSHNVQKMSIKCLYQIENIEFPLSFFVSQSVKDLTLIGSYRDTRITSTRDLLALTTLHLIGVTFKYDNPDEFGGLFSKCPNLKNLTLADCEIDGFDCFITISHPQLSTLTVINGYGPHVVNVVAPHLKFLTVVNCKGGLISAPELSSLTYEIRDYFEFSTDGLLSLEKVDIYICDPNKAEAPKIIEMLQQFRNVKYLTLGLEIVEVLATSMQLLSHLPSPFANLTSFKIYPANTQYFPCRTFRPKEEEQKKINMPIEVKNYLLNGSPNATVTIFSHQDAQALKNATLAQQSMTDLQILLTKEKIECETNQSTAPMKRHRAIMNDQLKSHFENCWEDFFEQINQGGIKIKYIFSTLHRIEYLLEEELPASKKDRIQSRFSSLREEAYSVIKLITRSKAALVPDFVNLP
ncbi:F-box/LRR-repeat protein At3g26922-like [Rutidosis leptorrhynchoides]|uniref:F-box/LRR-repeat protein At3g26922-like n=1 Tax=Rutidosis leptorrhynchoides TaxID=125765 RepID=UPI003A99FC18